MFPRKTPQNLLPRGRRQMGQALVELALLLVPLVLLMLGGIALYELVRVQSVVDRAATEAVRAAAATRLAVGTDAQAMLARAQGSGQARARIVLGEAGFVSEPSRVSIDGDFSAMRSDNTVLVDATVYYTHYLSPASRAILKPWFPDGLVHLEGHAHEAFARYASALP